MALPLERTFREGGTYFFLFLILFVLLALCSLLSLSSSSISCLCYLFPFHCISGILLQFCVFTESSLFYQCFSFILHHVLTLQYKLNFIPLSIPLIILSNSKRSLSSYLETLNDLVTNACFRALSPSTA